MAENSKADNTVAGGDGGSDGGAMIINHNKRFSDAMSMQSNEFNPLDANNQRPNESGKMNFNIEAPTLIGFADIAPHYGFKIEKIHLVQSTTTFCVFFIFFNQIHF